MSFIVFDLEFNQEVSFLEPSGLAPSVEPVGLERSAGKSPRFTLEIIQIGAVKLDAGLNTVGTFHRYVKPTFHQEINPFVSKLTGIYPEQLAEAQQFTKVYPSYLEFIGGKNSVFCVWGMTDLIELMKNVRVHGMDYRLLPDQVINLQPHVSKLLRGSAKKLIRLQHAVEMLQIPISLPFHNALHDAYYTAEILRKIDHKALKPTRYDPLAVPTRPVKRKQVIDTEKLLQQFEKMYGRKMSEEEQQMIMLAYKMGRTHQFLKEQ